MKNLWRAGFLVHMTAAGILLIAACAPAAPPAPKEAAAPPPAVAPPPAAAPKEAPAPKPAVAPKEAPAAKPAAPKIVRFAFGVEPESKDPYGHSSSAAYGTWLDMFDALTDYDHEKKAIVGALAESWENPNPTTWRFKLRKGVKFHDGSDFTAKDVVHSITRIKTDPVSKQASALTSVEAAVAVDDYTVDMKTNTVYAPLLFQLISRVMTSKEAFEKYGKGDDRALVGTGAYKFKEFIQGQRIVTTKNPNYWKGAPQADEVVYRPIAEPAARVTALLNDEVDIVEDVPPELLERVTGPKYRVEGFGSLKNFFLAMNPIEGAEAEPLKDVRVRRAISHAIDRDSIVRDVLKGQGYVRNDGPISPDFFGYDPDLKPTYPYDPAKAKQLLAEAGYPNGFKIDQWSMQGVYLKDKEVSEAINAMLKKVGVDATLKTAEWGTYFGDLIANGKMPLYLIERGDAVDPNPYLHQYFRTGVSKRIRGFSDPKVDELLLKEQAILDPEQRRVALRQAMSAIMEAAPAAWVFTAKRNFGVNNRVDWKPRVDNYGMGRLIKGVK